MSFSINRMLQGGVLMLMVAVQPLAVFAQDLWLNLPGAAGKPGSGKKVVLISGDEEYRS